MSIIITNETIKQLFHIAKSIARENYNEQYGAPHLLQALMHKEIDLRGFVESLEKDPSYFYDWADVRIEEYPKITQLPTDVFQDEHVESIIEAADDVRLRLGLDEITPLCMLTAIVKPGKAFSAEQLKSLPLREHEILNSFGAITSTYIPETLDVLQNASNSKTSSFPAIQKYCVDRTAQAKAGTLDPIIGREKETRNLVEILCRRSKPNVIITGEPGVGKTALVEGFAHEIISDNVPSILSNAVLLELDLGLLFSGASYKGEVEDRLKKVITESKKLDKAILVIDEIHILLDKNGAAGNIANLLKPELARGEITVIGITTQEEYRKIIEPEQAFNRRFEILSIEEPDTDTCVKMLRTILDNYKEHHEIEVDKNALPECVRLAKRYTKGKKLPDTAIDLMDRTMAAIRMLDELSPKELSNWKEEYNEAIENEYESDNEKVKELQWMYSQLKNRISPILWGSLKEQPEIESTYTVDKAKDIIDAVYAELLEYSKIKREKVGELELAAVMAAKTNIPIGKIQAQEKEQLLNMESHLQKRVVGQDHALKVLSDAIVESRSGLNKPGQPIGSFFLLGPTGTGKTELAKSVAEHLFNDENAMIRFDMSEFKEEHSAALLYGAPPGYVGYEEGGVLVNKIREKPYSVVLFDEIEKAHQSVFDVFLQIMDEGKISDKLGKEGDFSNALVLFTSNIGSERIVESFEKDIIPASKELMEIMAGRFRPEFLARLTDIIPFAPISENIAEMIFKIQLKSLIKSLLNLGIDLSISDEAARNLAVTGFSSAYGARQISGVIRSQLARPISKKIVSEEIVKDQKITIEWDEKANKLLWNIS